MARNLDNKCKQCRREGVKLFLKGDRCNSSKCAMVKRNYIPGVHGPKQGSHRRLTGYGTQLREKQKAKKTYRLLEKQFRNYFDKAINQEGDTGENLYKLLERRLDNVIYLSGFAKSRDLARQLVSHGHFLINGKKLDIPSYQVRKQDKITISAKSLEMPAFIDLKERLKNHELAEWLAMDIKDLSVTVIGEPDIVKRPAGYDLKLITEFYSR